MEGRVLQMPGHKKTEAHPMKTYIVHFRAANSKPVRIQAKCFQPVNGVYIGFFNEISKEVGRAILTSRIIPDAIALFRSSDVSHVVEDRVMKGKVPVNALMNYELSVALIQGATPPEEFQGDEEE